MKTRAQSESFSPTSSEFFPLSFDRGLNVRTASSLVLTAGGIALAAVSARAQNGVTYTFTASDVPFATGGNTMPFAINARGDIVDRYFDSSTDGKPRGFLRYSDSTFAPPIDIHALNSGSLSAISPPVNAVGKQGPLSINLRGDLAGFYNDGTQGHDIITTKLAISAVTRESGCRTPRLQSTSRVRSRGGFAHVHHEPLDSQS